MTTVNRKQLDPGHGDSDRPVDTGAYLIFVVGTTRDVGPRQVVRARALNLGIGSSSVHLDCKNKWILKN